MPDIEELLSAALEAHVAGNLSKAERLYQEALQVDPRSVSGLANLGAVLQAQKDLERASQCYRLVLEIDPHHAQSLGNLGSIYKDRRQFDEAIDFYRRALAVDPELAAVHYNLGGIYHQQRDFRQAEACYRQAIRLKPDYAHAYNNLGTLCREQNWLAEASDCYELAIRYRADLGDARRNRAVQWLTLGDFERGWPEFEWRFRAPGSPQIESARPRWAGEPLPDRTILIIAEHGLGDTIQFIRYAALVKARSRARVHVQVQDRMSRLIATVTGVDHVTERSAPVDPFDAYIPILSLPALFETRVETVPASIPYLAAETPRVEAWKSRLSDLTGFRVGLAWQGNPGYGGDYARSVPLDQFAPLLSVPGVQFVSLQKGFGSEQLAASVVPVRDLGESFDRDAAFVDTAAVMRSLDLVIASDSAVAHLAGAMGIPVWVALPHVPDWRWMIGRADSPWYPTMRLFRPDAPGDWPTVMRRMADELAEVSRTSAAQGSATQR